MRVRVKICGLTLPEEIDAAVASGADAIGFVFAASPRQVSPSLAHDLSDRVPPFVSRVAVFAHPTPKEIDEVVRRVHPDWIQTDLADEPLLQDRQAGRFLAVVRNPTQASRLKAGTPILFEGAHSGAGELADWEGAATLARQHPLILAGGLTPSNVVEAIRRIRPFGVDVSSGVEERPGRKSTTLIKEFLEAVRHAT